MTKTAPTPKKQAKIKVNVAALFKLWYSALKREEIAKKLGISQSHLSRLAAQHKLAPKISARTGKSKNVDPTLAEIEQLKKEVQRNWSEDDYIARSRGSTTRGWKMPAFEYDKRSHTFSAGRLEHF